MTTIHWILIAWLAFSGLAVFVRGFAGSVRRYTELDAIFGVIEVGIMIWLVTKL